MHGVSGAQFERLRCKTLSQLWMVLLKKYSSVPVNQVQTMRLPGCQLSLSRLWTRYRIIHEEPLSFNNRVKCSRNIYRTLYTSSHHLCSNDGRSSGSDYSEHHHENPNENESKQAVKGERDPVADGNEALLETATDPNEPSLDQQIELTSVNKSQTDQNIATKSKREPEHKTVRFKAVDKAKYDTKSFTSLEMTNKFLDSTDFPVTEDITELLSSYEIPYDEGFTGYHLVCPKFGKLAMKKRKREQRLYINNKSGYFVCSACRMSGYWSYLKENIQCQKAKKASKTRVCFKDVSGVSHQVEEVPPDVQWQLDHSEPISNLSPEQFDNMLAIFDWHGIAMRTFADYGVRYRLVDNQQYFVLFPIQSMQNGITKAVRVYKGVVSDDDDVKVTVNTYPRRDLVDVFGWQHQPTQKTLVITSSEVNAMAIAQATRTTALALNSNTQLPLEILAPLEEFSKIILWIGTDINAWECTNTFAKKLNDRRCYIFRLNTVVKMPLQLLQDEEEDLKSLLQEARLISHKDIVKFSHLRGNVYSELAHLSQVAGVQWQKYTPLNRLMKGHRRGELTVLTGPTGSGKTTFVSDYSLDLCRQGVNTLWGSFEINNVKLAKMMLRQFSGKDLTKHLEDFDEVADDFGSLPMYYMTYFGQENINKVLEVMTHAVYVHDISHVVIDNLQFMMGMDYTESNRFLKQDQVVATFRRFATEKNCHVTLITHPRKVDDNDMLSTASIFGSAKLTQEADNVLLIQDLILNKSLGRVKLLQIAKNRFDGELDILMMNFDKESLGFTLKDKLKAKKGPQNKDKQQLSADLGQDDGESS